MRTSFPFAGLGERALDAVRDEVERRSALSLPRLARVMRQHEHRRSEGGILGPVDLALVEHAPPHHVRARALEHVLHQLVVVRRVASAHAEAVA
ncbi:MAG: hypothetical protein JJD97_05110 [Gemmatimonadaceae bacterium]|nr:hypothetical protein [Gemmatimonadaceae bacterium]